jgi:ankyrin repeat protein
MVKHLISNEEDINKCDCERRCPLHLASSLGFTQIVKLLIENGARVNARDNDWVSPLHRACRNNHEDVVSQLLESGAEANTRDRSWITPMHVCAANNALECAKVLLPHVTSIDASDRMGATPLHHAVFNSHCDLITFLLANGAQANAFDKTDRRPIHYAAAVDSTDAIRFLVVRGEADVNVHDKELMTPLHIAAAKGSVNALHLLLDYGAKIEAIDTYGNTAIHWAAIHGQDDIIDELILRGAQLNCVNNDGITPLHLASASTMGSSALDVLLTNKESIDINFRDKYGRTALHLAAKYGRHNRIPDLIRCGADCSLTDKKLATPLHYAARNGHTPVIDVLISSGNIDVNIFDTNGMTPLHYSSFAGISSACKRLLDANSNPHICDTCGRTPHFMASYSGNIECLQMLMPLPDKLNDAFNRSLLHYASSGQSFECLNYLLDNYSQMFDVNQRDLYGMTALHYASISNEDNDTCVEICLKYGSKANIPDNNGFYPIHFAAATGITSALHLLISAHNWKDVKLDVCPTHCAAFYGKQESLQLLLENDFQDIGPALEYSILKEHNGCVKVILDFLNDSNSCQFSKFSSHIINQSILVASQYALHDTLNLLLNYVNNIDFSDHRGRTPLMLAALNDSGAECVELLLQNKANPNATDSQKRNALFYAIYSGVEESVKCLLKFGALPQSRCVNGKTAYHIASLLGQSDILWTLLNFDNSFSPETLTDREGLTPIHWSALKSQPSCLNALLEFVTLKKFSGNKITPLHLAAYVIYFNYYSVNNSVFQSLEIL